MTPSASGSTPGGLPYPTSADYLGQTDVYIGELADAVAVRLANPGQVFDVQTVNTDGSGIGRFTFGALSALGGLVVIPVVADFTTLCPIVRAMNGNTADVQFWYPPYNTQDSINRAYTNRSVKASVIAWGAPA